MVRALPERLIAAPRVLGVDEFAFPRGRRYGTILVDAGAHRIVDLLEDPSADALVEWLGKHPGTEVICRDRDGVYASAARRGAPNALQVADRWHLVHNLADALERFAVRVLASLRKDLKAEATVDATPQSELQPPATFPGRLKTRTEQRHAEIQELRRQGLTIAAISRRLRLTRKTVYRFVRAEAGADLLGARGRRATALDPYSPYLAKQWRDGLHVAAYLFEEIWEEGLSRKQAHRATSGGRLAHGRTTSSGPCAAARSAHPGLAVAPPTI